MKLFSCSACKQLLFFENVQCESCGRRLAYLPDRAVVSALEPVAGEHGVFVALAGGADERYKSCANATEHGVCNWALPAGDDATLCRACVLNRTIPNLASPEAARAWQKLEIAKRRLLYSLIQLGLPTQPKLNDERGGLAFDFKEDLGTEKVLTGHSDGVITINIAEADDAYREHMRQQLGEAYRTLLGHFRHESGHYFWDRLVRDSHRHEPFRALFGDERADYAAAGTRHYAQGAPADWSARFVSPYASMHPWEDWAETFAHYLHMVDTLETARSHGLSLRPQPVGGASAQPLQTRGLHFEDFHDLVSAWTSLAIALNSLNRSMGLADPYPFVLTDLPKTKLRFVHDVIEEARSTE